MVVGVFDSGKGGQFVAEKLRLLLPHHTFQTVSDVEHMPYGDKTAAEIIRLTNAAVQPLLKTTSVIVIACNTATAIAIDWLREHYPQHSFVGYEPMLKPLAALTSHGAVLATCATRRSDRYKLLKQAYAQDISIDEPDTTNWAYLIEHNQAAAINFSELRSCIEQGADTIALSCTHYLQLENTLHTMFPSVMIIEPTKAVAQRVQSVISKLSPQSEIDRRDQHSS